MQVDEMGMIAAVEALEPKCRGFSGGSSPLALKIADELARAAIEAYVSAKSAEPAGWKVTALNADYIAPVVTLHQTLERIDQVETVVLVAYLKCGGVHVGHSSGDDSRLVYMAVCADEFMRKKIRGEDDAG